MDIYRRAVEHQTLPRAEVPECLLALGVLSPVPDRPDTVCPVPPATASALLLRPIEQRLESYAEVVQSTRAAFSALEATYDAARRREGPGYALLQGETTISDVLVSVVNSCRQELLTVQPGGARPMELLATALRTELPRLRDGIRQRTLYQHAVRSHAPTMEYVARISEAGAQVRTVAQVFDRMIIVDREVAYIPARDERGVAALEIRQPGIIRFLVRLFEHLWEQGVPVCANQRRDHLVMSDIQRAILRAVVNGETDEVVARRVGMSRRSVAEHVRKISLQLGSNSRAQLGYLVAVNGILNSDDDSANPPS